MYFNFTYWYQLILPTSLTRLQPNDWVEPSPPQDAKQEWLDGGVKKIESLWGGQAGCEIFWIEKKCVFSPTKGGEPQVIIQVELVILLFSWGNPCWNSVPQFYKTSQIILWRMLSDECMNVLSAQNGNESFSAP